MVKYKQLVCLNGHQVTDRLELSSNKTGFCKECGEQLISTCPKCSAPIEGDETTDGVVIISTYTEPVPNFCNSCGFPYPWTKSAIKAAKELITFSNLQDAEKEDAKNSIDDLVANGSRTKLAEMKIKSFISKAGSSFGSALHDILVDVASESVKKAIWGA